MSDNKSGKDSSSRTTIIVTLITVIGTLGAAFIGSWDKIFAPKPDTSAQNSPSPSSTQLPTPVLNPLPSPDNFASTEISKVEQLDVGLSRVKVEEIFGTPMTARKVCSSDIRESCPLNLRDKYTIHMYSFEAYDLRVIYDEDSIVFFAVTSKRKDFNPKFQPIPIAEKPENNKLGLASFTEIAPEEPTQYNLFRGASARNWYWETRYLGGAGRYLTFYLAYSSVGADTSFSPENADKLATLDSTESEEQKTNILQSFRAYTVPNTYGFFKSDGDFSELIETLDFFFLDAILYEGVDNLY